VLKLFFGVVYEGAAAVLGQLLGRFFFFAKGSELGEIGDVRGMEPMKQTTKKKTMGNE
jgi:hypothetical protein